MRTMMTIRIPTEAANRAMRDGSAPRVIQAGLEALRPEAAYFFPSEEGRVILLVIDLADPSDIPAAVEPFTGGLDAKVSLTPVMNLADFRAGLGKLPPK